MNAAFPEARRAAACCLLLCAALPAGAQDADSLMLANGVSLLGVPYAAHTLDRGAGEEELVVNCDEVDCATFVEYALAMSLCPLEDGQIAEGDFIDNVQRVRYRDGKVDGYASRLHYVTDWINNGVRNGFLEDVAARESKHVQAASAGYMTTHPSRYRQLAGSEANREAMARVEAGLEGQLFHYVPAKELPAAGLPWIKGGDIIAVTTDTPGLDIAHMGIAFYVKGVLCLLHASRESGQVEVSRKPLSRMLEDAKHWTGIRVLRAKRQAARPNL